MHTAYFLVTVIMVLTLIQCPISEAELTCYGGKSLLNGGGDFGRQLGFDKDKTCTTEGGDHFVRFCTRGIMQWTENGETKKETFRECVYDWDTHKKHRASFVGKSCLEHNQLKDYNPKDQPEKVTIQYCRCNYKNLCNGEGEGEMEKSPLDFVNLPQLVDPQLPPGTGTRDGGVSTAAGLWAESAKD